MGILSGLLGGITTDITDFFTAIEDFFSALVDPHTYIRMGSIILGAVLVIAALRYGH